MEWNGMGWDGVTWDGMGCERMKWNGIGWSGMEWGRNGKWWMWDGMLVGSDPTSFRECKVCSLLVGVRIFSTRAGAFREGLKVF